MTQFLRVRQVYIVISPWGKWCWVARGLIILGISNAAAKMSAALREIAVSS